MTKRTYAGSERRQFVRLDYITPLAYKVCKRETISKLLQGYTSDVSAAGLLCNIKEKVHKDDILWLAFDRATLSICEDLERCSLIYQNGIIGKVVRAEHRKEDDSYAVGVQFIIREEKNLTHIYPKIHFLKLDNKEASAGEGSEEERETPQEEIQELQEDESAEEREEV
ncbi:PilZ domain-containing protein [bacterium]|nr:MAG: PilZ domain-containing protein [bacterium]